MQSKFGKNYTEPEVRNLSVRLEGGFGQSGTGVDPVDPETGVWD